MMDDTERLALIQTALDLGDQSNRTDWRSDMHFLLDRVAALEAERADAVKRLHGHWAENHSRVVTATRRASDLEQENENLRIEIEHGKPDADRPLWRRIAMQRRELHRLKRWFESNASAPVTEGGDDATHR